MKQSGQQEAKAELKRVREAYRKRQQAENPQSEKDFYRSLRCAGNWLCGAGITLDELDQLEIADLAAAGHTILDGLGLGPGGFVADLFNCAWYGLEGEALNASLSCAAAVPIAGQLLTITKWGRNGIEVTEELLRHGSILAKNKKISEAAEAAVLARHPGADPQAYFPTSLGKRYIDVLTSEGKAIEVKVGRVGLGGPLSQIRKQVRKDLEILGDPDYRVKSLEWEFFVSPITGKGGPTSNLRKYLAKMGIEVVVRS